MAKLYVVLLSFVSTAADRVRNNDEGATAVEYGLMVALIAAIIVGIVGTLGGQVSNAFQTVSSQMP
jgi:pilus assembly protein Flp/PilA